MTNFLLWDYYGTKSSISGRYGPEIRCCSYKVAAEQKARTTYDNILRLVDDPDILDPIRFLRQREVVHYQRFGEALRHVQDQLHTRNFYACNPSFDKCCGN